jgi:hypothetical protein
MFGFDLDGTASVDLECYDIRLVVGPIESFWSAHIHGAFTCNSRDGELSAQFRRHEILSK